MKKVCCSTPRTPGGEPLLPADAGIGSNDKTALERAQRATSDEALIDEKGGLTEAGLRLARKNGQTVRSGSGLGITGSLKE